MKKIIFAAALAALAGGAFAATAVEPLDPGQDALALQRANARNASRTGSNAFAYGVVLSAMPGAVGSPNYAGTFTRYGTSAVFTLWRQTVDGKERLFIQVSPASSPFFFCPGGNQFSVMQNGKDYGSSLRATTGDNNSVCRNVSVPEIFLIDQWSLYTNFNEGGAFDLSYLDKSSSYAGAVSLAASNGSSTTTTATTTTTTTTSTPATTTCPSGTAATTAVADYTATFNPALDTMTIPRLKFSSATGDVYFKIDLNVISTTNPMVFTLKGASGAK
jgi:hypothetical protein